MFSGRREAIKLAVQCSSAVAGTAFAASSFTAVLHRVFAVESHQLWFAPIIISLSAGVFWFVLMIALGAFGLIAKTVDSRNFSSRKLDHDRHFALNFVIALGAALMLALSAWLVLQANDDFFYSRLLPWIPSLIRLQEAGILVVSRWFPYKYEGFDAGCEAYKTIPVFILSNTFAYLPFSLATVFLIRCRKSTRLFLRKLASAFLRWGSLVGIALLCIRLVVHRWSPDVSIPTAIGGMGRTMWLLLEWTSGPISVVFFLSIPFVLYRAICAVWKNEHISESLVDVTRVAAFVLAAMILGNQYQ